MVCKTYARLGKYIPFLDYIIENDSKKFAEFQIVKNWIFNNNKLTNYELLMCERSIKIHFDVIRKRSDVVLPKQILDIFEAEKLRIEYVNLSSDDETTESNKKAGSKRSFSSKKETVGKVGSKNRKKLKISTEKKKLEMREVIVLDDDDNDDDDDDEESSIANSVIKTDSNSLLEKSTNLNETSQENDHLQCSISNNNSSPISIIISDDEEIPNDENSVDAEVSCQSNDMNELKLKNDIRSEASTAVANTINKNISNESSTEDNQTLAPKETLKVMELPETTESISEICDSIQKINKQSLTTSMQIDANTETNGENISKSINDPQNNNQEKMDTKCDMEITSEELEQKIANTKFNLLKMEATLAKRQKITNETENNERSDADETSTTNQSEQLANEKTNETQKEASRIAMKAFNKLKINERRMSILALKTVLQPHVNDIEQLFGNKNSANSELQRIIPDNPIQSTEKINSNQTVPFITSIPTENLISFREVMNLKCTVNDFLHGTDILSFDSDRPKLTTRKACQSKPSKVNKKKKRERKHHSNQKSYIDETGDSESTNSHSVQEEPVQSDSNKSIDTAAIKPIESTTNKSSNEVNFTSLTKNVRVLVRRLSQNTIDRLSNKRTKSPPIETVQNAESTDYLSNERAKSPPTETVQQIEYSIELRELICAEHLQQDIFSPPKNKRTKSIQKKYNLKNTDKSMTEYTMKHCVLCLCKPIDMTRHFLSVHKTESYTSRLHAEVLKILKCTLRFVAPLQNSQGKQKYVSSCPFCCEEIRGTFMHFHCHFSRHTGEYAFQCEKCKILRPYRFEIVAHQMRAKRCANRRIRIMYRYPENLKTIYLYCCKLCNFVQLNEANTLRHLREQHSFVSGEASHVEKYIAAAIRDSEPNNFCNRDYNIPVVNECETFNVDADENLYSEPMLDFPQLLKIFKSEESSFHEHSMVSQHVTDDNTETPLNQDMIVEKSNNNAEASCDNKTLLYRIKNGKDPMLIDKNKVHESYRLISKNAEDYIGLFKCMATDCYYCTDIDENMIEHLNNHSLSECPPAGFLECAYCQLNAVECKTSHELVSHIRMEHEYGRYQCNKCCYRACTLNHVEIHLKAVHQDQANTIIQECMVRGDNYQQRYEQLKVVVENLSIALICPWCNEEFVSPTLIREHTIKYHTSGTLTDYAYEPYICLFCDKSDGLDICEMQLHLALTHPNAIPYALKIDIKDTMNGNNSTELIDVNENNPLKIPTPKFTPYEKVKIVNKTSISSEQKESISNTMALPTLSQSTAMAPDNLYHCPIKTCSSSFSAYALWDKHMEEEHNRLTTNCVHCKLNALMMDMKKQLKLNRNYMFYCFECNDMFDSQTQPQQHIAGAHADFGKGLCAQIVVEEKIYYFILLSERLHKNYLKLLEEFVIEAKEELSQLCTSNAINFSNKWALKSNCFDLWLTNLPIYSSHIFSITKCSYCTLVSNSFEENYKHMLTHEDNDIGIFHCPVCDFECPHKNGEKTIYNHYLLHSKVLFLCCHCYYLHHDRQKMNQHIKDHHRWSDIFVLTISRNTMKSDVALSIIFKENNYTLLTYTYCFFCQMKFVDNSTELINHFEQTHDIKMSYFCDNCSKPLAEPKAIDNHDMDCNAKNYFRIRVDLNANDKFHLFAMKPMKIKLCSKLPIQNEPVQVMMMNSIENIIIEKGGENVTREIEIAQPNATETENQNVNDNANANEIRIELEPESVIPNANIEQENNEPPPAKKPLIRCRNIGTLLANPQCNANQNQNPQRMTLMNMEQSRNAFIFNNTGHNRHNTAYNIMPYNPNVQPNNLYVNGQMNNYQNHYMSVRPLMPMLMHQPGARLIGNFTCPSKFCNSNPSTPYQ